MTQLVTMYDTIGADAAHIPPSAVKVGGYVTGTGIAWPPSAWERFSHAGRVRIDQSPAGEAYRLEMTGTGGGKTYRTGAGGTLKSLNLDLSVADAAWFPAPAPPGAPWQAQALRMARELEQSAQGLRAFLGAHQ